MPIRQMLRLGMPIGAQQALEAGAFGAIGLLMGMLGTIEMAAHQIAITLAAFTFMVPLGVGSAAAVRVGHAIGAQDHARANAAIRAAYLCGVGFMVLTAIIFLAEPYVLARAFTGDSRVIALAAILIPIAGVFQVFDGGQAVGAGVLRGAGDTTAPLLVMLAAYWLVGVPVSAYLGFRTSLRAAGLWWGFVVSLAAVAIFLFLRIRVVFRRGIERVRVDGAPRSTEDRDRRSAGCVNP
jgi:MATE family multidrug resistance protein